MGLPFKVYAGANMVAATGNARDAVMVAMTYAGSRVKYAGRVVWSERADRAPAGQPLDPTVAMIHRRVDAHNRAGYARAYGVKVAL